MEMVVVVVVAMVNRPMVLSFIENSVDNTLVGRWYICAEKKMQGVSPIHNGSQVLRMD